MAKRKFFEKKEDEVEEKVTEEVQEQSTKEIKEEKIVEENKKDKFGKLIDCELLNARKDPNKESEVLFVINNKNKIKILEELSDFYKVEVNGKEAYCMKNFIKTK